MSLVYYLDVFDPEGLPAGLSDSDAAQQSKNRQLAAPSPRLVALLARIRQRPPGITVNVVGGQEQQPVQWHAGPPPRVEGRGARCALWTLILPVEDDVAELENAVPKLVACAQALGLRVHDAQRQAFEHQQRQLRESIVDQVPGGAVRAAGLPGAGDILILDRVAFLGRNHHSVGAAMRLKPGLNVRQAVQLFLENPKREQPEDASLQRLLSRLLQAFPYDIHGPTLWCGRNPLHEPVFSSDGVRMVRVAAEQLQTVMRTLLPLARELFLSVAVPDLDFFVDRSGDPDEFKAQPLDLLKSLDPGWKLHRMPKEEVHALYQRELGAVLARHGFAVLAEVGPYQFAFSRPLRMGGGRQVISYGGDGLCVESAERANTGCQALL